MSAGLTHPQLKTGSARSRYHFFTGCCDSFSAELPGNTGDYEEYKIFGESGSWYSRRRICATDRSKPRPNNPQTQPGTGHGEINGRGRRQLSGKFPVHPGTRTRPGYRVAPPRDHRMCARLLFSLPSNAADKWKLATHRSQRRRLAHIIDPQQWQDPELLHEV